MLLKPSSIPANVIIAVVLMRLLTSKLFSEAEIEIGPWGGTKTQKFSIT